MSLMTSPADISRFAMAGNARLTLTSLKTGTRFTYRVREADDKKLWFVSVLTGSDNENSYTYMGVIRPTIAGPVFQTTSKSRIKDDAPAAKGFRFFWHRVVLSGEMPTALEVRHENHCGRCGRVLTVPESIDSGLGPDCREMMGL